jgi:uncharacterized protein (DUF1684 family)
MKKASDYEELLDYRRTVAAMYARVRSEGPGAAGRCARFRRERNILFAEHPQSPLPPEDKGGFEGLEYFDYDPSLRYVLPVEDDVEPDVLEIQLPKEGLLRLRRFGRAQFADLGEATLSLFWIEGYGGGVFVPFKDATSGREAYGGGRYLLDTIKHADLGREEGSLVLDFNYAYNPSCAYNADWVCPLAPPENTLPVEVRAGEKAYAGPQSERR